MRKSTHSFEYAVMRKQLGAIRVAAGLSQRQLASKLSVPHSWVAKVESGERRIDLIEFGWLCEACGVSPSDEARALFAQTKTNASRRRGGSATRRPR
jgi:transcriptional regulator with XRE-family HTH domain